MEHQISYKLKSFHLCLSQPLVLKATNSVALKITIIKKWIFISS